MSKSLNLFKKLTPLVFILSIGLFVASCGEDDVIGCTDPAAENFDAEANVSGDCVFSRDQFLGSYLGSFTCMESIFADVVNSDSLVFTITQGVDDDVSNVVVNLVIDGFPVPLRGTISGNVMTVSDMLVGVPIELPFIGPVMADVLGEGSTTYTAETSTLAGDIALTIDIDSPLFPEPIMDICGLIGIKQE